MPTGGALVRASRGIVAWVVAGLVTLGACAPGNARAALPNEACTNVSLSFPLDPNTSTGTLSGSGSCTVGTRSGAVTISGDFRWGVSCPSEDVGLSGNATVRWADGSTAFVSGYRIEVLAWQPRNPVTQNLSSAEVSVGFTRGEGGVGDLSVHYDWFGGPALAAQHLSPCDHPYGDVVSFAVSARALTVAGTTPPPVVAVAPEITGRPQSGATLFTNNGTWAFFPSTFAYQWQRCDASGNGCGNVAGATSGAYVAVAADVGHTLRSVVTACSPGGCASSPSKPTPKILGPGPFNTRPPELRGNAVQGEDMLTSTGSWDPGTGISYAYRWERCDASGGGCVTIAGQTMSNYTMRLVDVGHRIRSVVIASNTSGSNSAVSATSDVVVLTTP